MKIGLSVSLCVRDIALGKVKEADVVKIMGSTSCPTPEAWEEVIDRYKEIYWKPFQPEADKIVRRLLADGKIEQPRQTRHQMPDISQTIWVDSEGEIQWRNAA